MRIVRESQGLGYRIVEREDLYFCMKDLKGDTFNPVHNHDIDPDKLRDEELLFEAEVYREGVYGYVLERWNPEYNKGWEHADSCWGFVGAYDPKSDRYNHYIVDELWSR